MRTLLSCFAFVAVCAAAIASAQQSDFSFKLWDSPRPIADLSFTDADGRQLSLGAFRGKTILLNVWATWCAPCRKEMPALDRLQQELGGDRFQVIALSIDTGGLGDVKPFYDDLGLGELDIFLDEQGSAMRDLRVIGLPSTLLIDRQGREVGRKEGAVEWDSAEVITFLREQIAGSPLDARPLE